ncbi:extracellular scp domain protein [Neofusicoccum parvum]|uniref:Extracellular scp domain protein n=1 Tax=Neofusicoccum parvum TaxID=310453 RepID=A0ACB5SPP3_9PEZI|nr:extracellular scp domain protein [Neofusicoccum parvum]GME52066.1 extracellular scp domain protein [Neofusicoccum parvum]
MGRCRSRQSKSLLLSVLSATLLLASIHPAAAAPGGEPTTTIRHTSTITIVQTVYPSTEAAAVATGTASAATDEHSYTDDGVFKNTVLDVSNTVRQNYNASELAWNDTLADYAQSWSEGCKFEHSVRRYIVPSTTSTAR